MPYLGLLIALIQPPVLALAESGPGAALAVVVGGTLLSPLAENVLEPTLTGRVLESTWLVFTMFFVWVWVLGPAGALLSMPIAVLLVLVAVAGRSRRRRGTSARPRHRRWARGVMETRSMSGIDELLVASETVALETRQHRYLIVREIVLGAIGVVLALAAGATIIASLGSSGREALVAVGAIVVGLVAGVIAGRARWRLLCWKFTWYVVTDRRVIVRAGVTTRHTTSAWLDRVSETWKSPISPDYCAARATGSTATSRSRRPSTTASSAR